MSYRRIMVNGVGYRWKFGSGGTLGVRGDDGRSSLREPVTKTLDITWGEFERGQWKRHLSVKPSDVRRRILARLRKERK